MEKAIKISVIICTYNRDKYIYDTLKYIAENNFPAEQYEILLINNNSTDDTEKECQRFHADFPVPDFHYFIETRQGLSFARNRGCAEALGDVLVFLDDDAFVNHNYLENLSRQIKAHPDFFAFGGKITPFYESGITPSWMSKWSYSWVSALNMGKQVRLFKGKAFPIGANMGFRKCSIEQYGYFNTELGRNKNNLMGGEEKDYFNRLKAGKEKIYYFPDIEVRHVIPEKRTTKEFIIKLAIGIGRSERLRTLKISKSQYFHRLIAEAIKWAASIILYIGYILALTPQKGWFLLLFRQNVTKGLLGRDSFTRKYQQGEEKSD